MRISGFWGGKKEVGGEGREPEGRRKESVQGGGGVRERKGVGSVE